MSEQGKRLGDLLLEIGSISKDDLADALNKQKESKERLGDLLLDLGYVKPEDLTRALAEQFEMDIIDLDDYDIDPDVIEKVPQEFAREHHLVPLELEDDQLTVATSDPLDLDVMDNLRFLINCNVECVLATKQDIDKALQKYYGMQEHELDEAINEFTENNIEFRKEDMDLEDEGGGDDAPVIRLVTLIISEAVKSRASDIHVEPMADKLRIRYRIDGECYEVESPPKRLPAGRPHQIVADGAANRPARQ